LSPAPAGDTSRFALGALCAIGTILIWAGWLVAMRVGMAANLGVLDLIALRFAVAGTLLLPVVLRRGWALDRLRWPGLIALIVGGGAAYNLSVGAGLIFAPVSHASAFTQGILPLTTAIVAAVMLKEKLPQSRKLGIALIISGAVTIAGVSALALGRQSIGHLILVSATILWATYSVVLRRSRLDGLHATAIAAVASCMVYLPIYLAFVGPHRLLAAPWQEILWQGAYQGVATALVSMVLYGYAIALIGPSASAAFISLGPVIAALLAIPILHEWPSLTDWLGIFVISAGVFLASGGAQLFTSASRPAPPP
jgi:drug/metabolite transporter (DMT)-like permease